MHAGICAAGIRRPNRAALAAVLALAGLALPAAGPAFGQPAARQGAVARPAAPAPERSAEAPAQAGRDTLAIMIDHAKVVRLPERAQTVIIGNPMIADVTVQKNGVLIVTGKSYGVTNMLALDAAGGMIAESLISVQAPTTESLVTVQRGFERESYSCTPSCQPAALLGDSTKHFGDVSGQAGQRDNLASKR